MNKRFLLATLLLLPAAGALAAPAKPKTPSLATARTQIQAQYKRYMEAVQRRDTAGAMSMFAPNFSISLPDGRSQGRADAMADLRTWMISTAGVHNWSMKIVDIKPKGKEFVATVNESLTRYVLLPRGGTETVMERSVSRDHWSLTPRGWKLHWIELQGKTSQRDKAQVRKQVEARYAQHRKALLAGDAAGVTAVMSPEYYEQAPGGKTTSLRAYQNALRNVLKQDKITAHSYTLKSLGMKGDRAIVKLTQQTTAIRKERGKPHTWVFKDAITDTWVHEGRDWFLRYREYTDSQSYRDGKLMR